MSPLLTTRGAGSATGFGRLREKTLPYGITAAFESIAKITVTSAASTFSFTSIPGTYQVLQVRFIGRSGRGNVTDGWLNVQINNSFGTRLHWHSVAGEIQSHTSSHYDNPFSGNGSIIAAPGTGSGADEFGAGVLEIYDYASTVKHKTVRILSQTQTSGGGYILHSTLLHDTTSAVTSITFGSVDTSNVQAGSEFCLYGIKSGASNIG